MAAIPDVEWLDPLIEPERSRELERYAKQKTGIYQRETGFFAAAPWLGRATIDLAATALVYLDRELADLIALVVSRDSSCRFCYATTRLLLRIMGVPEDRIRALERGLETAELDARTRVAFEFARRISRSNPLPSEADRKALLEAGYSAGEIAELAFAAGENVFYNRCATLAALPPQQRERLAESWLIRLLRPLLARPFRKRRKKGQPVFLSDEQKRGPYADVVLALDGLPAAPALRKILDEAWDSPPLSGRAKALVFAVVARGLGCSRSEREAFRLLDAEGVEPGEVEEILAHLGSPRLDPIEAKILPYARETIWYEPAAVQRRGLQLREQLSTAQFLDVVGIASLANMVCRLAIVLDEP
jgi:AhpD family alkylhydroperoxidase